MAKHDYILDMRGSIKAALMEELERLQYNHKGLKDLNDFKNYFLDDYQLEFAAECCRQERFPYWTLDEGTAYDWVNENQDLFQAAWDSLEEYYTWWNPEDWRNSALVADQVIRYYLFEEYAEDIIDEHKSEILEILAQE